MTKAAFRSHVAKSLALNATRMDNGKLSHAIGSSVLIQVPDLVNFASHLWSRVTKYAVKLSVFSIHWTFVAYGNILSKIVDTAFGGNLIWAVDVRVSKHRPSA